MSQYIDLAGIRTWYVVHSHTPAADGPIAYEATAADTIQFIEQVVGGPARLMGMSDGVITALHVALRRPDLVLQLAFIGGVFHRDAWHTTALEADPDNPEIPDFMLKSYASVAPDWSEHAPVVARKLARMHALPPILDAQDLAGLPMRVLVIVGDEDEVPVVHALEMYEALPHGKLAVVPGTSHGLLADKPALCNAILLDFFCNEAVETYAPIRRKESQPIED